MRFWADFRYFKEDPENLSFDNILYNSSLFGSEVNINGYEIR